MSYQHGPMPFPRRGSWPSSAAPDPVTGLVGFPEFSACLPSFVAEQAARGRAVGLAIGDVDHLKSYVEDTNADGDSFGHVAGNAYMTALGRICAGWFHTSRFPAGCVSTFGGDEVITTAAVADPHAFRTAIATLRDHCRAQLPRTVSFASTVITPPLSTDASCVTGLLSQVDAVLFRRKAARTGANDLGFVVDLTEGMLADVGSAA